MSGEHTTYSGEGGNYIVAPLSGWYAVTAFAFPVYLLLGVPIAYLIDYISKKMNKKFTVETYLLKMIESKIILFT